ncbi:hypothetical protein KCP73_03750 [Salmonella enterica subsp. enterica]|nr:hypothetical protein KCP73_03750 [Salmonella enterica subsp. enterica]
MKDVRTGADRRKSRRLSGCGAFISVTKVLGNKSGMGVIHDKKCEKQTCPVDRRFGFTMLAIAILHRVSRL